MLSLLLSCALSQGAVIPAQPALVEVKRGRARVVRADGAEPLSAVDPATQAPGPAYLEVSAGSVVTVSWRGLATLRFEGPAAFEWEGGEAGGELGWRLVDAAALEAEVRRGVARLELPLGWQGDLRAGAYHLASTADGGTRVVHQAGEDLRLRCLGGEGGARPPVFLRAGETARLSTPPVLRSRPDTTAAAPAWPRCEWPWGRHGVPGRPDLGAGPAWHPEAVRWPFGPAGDPRAEPWDAASWPWDGRGTAVEPEPAPARVTAPVGAVDAVEPAPLTEAPEAPEATETPAEGDAAPEGPDGAPATEPTTDDATPSVGEPAAAPPVVAAATEPTTETDVEPTTEPAPTEEPAAEPIAAPPATPEAAPEVATEPAPESEAPSVEPEGPAEPRTPDVVTSGPLRHRPHPGFTVAPAGEGLWRARVAADASEPAVVLGSRFDLWVRPGGSILVDANGALRSHEGAVELKPAARR